MSRHKTTTNDFVIYVMLSFRLAVVVFTVFFQGGTIKFLVNLLDIDR